MSDLRLESVERFYDFHPINIGQILDAVRARGIARDAITEEVLQQHDQDHYGGTAATDRLIAEAGVRSDDLVLDVCSGMGGPARYLAWKTGCRVTGLDLTASRVAGATELTRLAGLAASVRFVHGNALEMPFDDASFTLAVAQELRPRARQAAAGRRVRARAEAGRAAGVLGHPASGRAVADDARLLFEGMTFSEIGTADGYAALAAENGMTVVRRIDLTEEWTRILVDRTRCTGRWSRTPSRGSGGSTSSATTGRMRTSSGCTAVGCSRGVDPCGEAD